MVELFREMLGSQFEAALCMVQQCVDSCKPEYWEGRIANNRFHQVAYHTLFFTDLYLSPSEDAFESRELHRRSGHERWESLSDGLNREGTVEYLGICGKKAIDILAAETEKTLAGPSGFSWRKTSRAELHVYNVRHIQHHVGQMSAYLRNADEMLRDPKALPWVGEGWRI